MELEQVKDYVVQMVNDIIEQKLSEGNDVSAEEVLNQAKASIVSMTTKVAELEVRISEDATKIESLELYKSEAEASILSKEAEIEALRVEKESILSRATAAEVTLDNLAKDKIASDRMAELEGLKVVRSEAKRVEQEMLVRGMTEEEYASYKEEMVLLRNEFISSISTVGSVSGDESDVNVEPVDVEGALESASVVLPNVETSNSNKSELWTNFGPALSEYISDRRNRQVKGK
jgi:hypothetical protein